MRNAVYEIKCYLTSKTWSKDASLLGCVSVSGQVVPRISKALGSFEVLELFTH
jgi:hypothetical protein